MRRSVHLHVGLHKTGTSSLQASCGANLGLLKSHGLEYPIIQFPGIARIPRDQERLRFNHSRLISNAFKKQVFWNGEASRVGRHENVNAAHYRNLLRQHLETSTCDLVYSAESFSSFDLEEMRALTDFFAKRRVDVWAYCCIRPPRQWIESLLAQKIAGQFGPRLDLQRALSEIRGQGLIRRRVENLRTALGESIAFYSFSSAVEHPKGPAGRFLSMLGADVRRLSVMTENSGVSDHSVRILSMISARMGARYDSRDAYQFHRHLPFRHAGLWAVPGPRFRLRAGEAELLVGELRRESEWLRDVFGGGFHEDESRHPDRGEWMENDAIVFIRNLLPTLDGKLRPILESYLSEGFC